jgi:hypothetical protein
MRTFTDNAGRTWTISITLAIDAFLEELIDFFPEARVRNSLRKIVDESRKVRRRLLDRAEQVLASFDADHEANRLLNSFGIAPASPDSTPGLSPCGNSA